MSKSIAEIMAEIEADRALKAELADNKRNLLVTAMLAACVAKVDIEFYGSGDSGSVEDPTIEMKPGFEKPEGLGKKIIEWADVFLQGTGVDWYNNDGGQGSLHFDLTVTPPHFFGDISVNETVSSEAMSWDEGAIESEEGE
jgi:hypothetical protein